MSPALSRAWREHLLTPPDKPPVCTAAAEGRLDEMFADYPADTPLPPEVLTAQGENRENFVHAAAKKGHLDQVIDLAEKTGTDLTPALTNLNDMGETPLMTAARTLKLAQVPEMFERLDLKLAPFLTRTNDVGSTLIDMAAAHGQLPEMLDIRKAAGEKIPADHLSDELVARAASNRQLSTARKLFGPGADLSWRRVHGAVQKYPQSTLGHLFGFDDAFFNDLRRAGAFRTTDELKNFMDVLPHACKQTFRKNPNCMRRYAAEMSRLKRRKATRALKPLPRRSQRG